MGLSIHDVAGFMAGEGLDVFLDALDALDQEEGLNALGQGSSFPGGPPGQ